MNQDASSPTTRPVRPSVFDPGSRTLYVFAILGIGAGVAFVGTAGSIAVRGTGAEIPAGADVVEGALMPGRLTDSPAGDPFLFGEVTLGSPGGSGIVDHRWRGPAGDERVRVETPEGPVAIRLPAVLQWRGSPTTEERVVQSLSGLPIVSTIDQAEAHVSPPFAIAVRALRPGDHIVARTTEAAGDILAVSDLYVGERATLEADLAGREAMRWPIVALMLVVGLASLALGYRALRRAAG